VAADADAEVPRPTRSLPRENPAKESLADVVANLASTK